jgi:hypothetical protein
MSSRVGRRLYENLTSLILNTSANAIAAKLNERKVRTARGEKWTHVQLGAILRPFDASAVAA